MSALASNRFLTLAGDDPRLRHLLLGFSHDPELRPLLIQSTPEWTFEFVPLSSLDRPSWIVIWTKALRPDSLVLSVGPILATLGWLLVRMRDTDAGAAFSISHAILTIIGILALHAAVNLFNDYHDHVRGWDRVREHGGARVISRGWLRARDVHRAAWAAFAVALCAGGPVVFHNRSSGLLLAIFALIGALEFAVSRFGLKYRGFAEITAWFMFGPLLTGGIAWAMTGQLLWQSLVLGSLFGSLALLCLHLKNFERILADGRAGLKTWPVRAGFDASKTFTYFCFGLISLSMACIMVLVDPAPERLIPAFALAVGLGPLADRVRKLESPLAGRMRGLHTAGLSLAWLSAIGFVIGDVVRNFDAFAGYLP